MSTLTVAHQTSVSPSKTIKYRFPAAACAVNRDVTNLGSLITFIGSHPRPRLCHLRHSVQHNPLSNTHIHIWK